MIRLLLFLAAIPVISGCSVFMASKSDGADATQICQCTTKKQLISLGSSLIYMEKIDDRHTLEVYQVPKNHSSAIRATMHGVLDVCTGLSWELVGTPIELYMGRPEYTIVRITHDNEKNVVTKVEIS
jgi:hypothetical protein